MKNTTDEVQMFTVIWNSKTKAGTIVQKNGEKLHFFSYDIDSLLRSITSFLKGAKENAHT